MLASSVLVSEFHWGIYLFGTSPAMAFRGVLDTPHLPLRPTECQARRLVWD